jgi:outer membrane protein
MSKHVAAVLAALVLMSGAAFARKPMAGARTRGASDPADKSDPVGGTGASRPHRRQQQDHSGSGHLLFLHQEHRGGAGADLSAKHDVTLDGAKIGTVKHLPPTLLVQYHFLPDATFRPYVGAGVNYTTFSKNKLLNGAASLEHDSFGLALQAGADVAIDKNWSINFDVKKRRSAATC